MPSASYSGAKSSRVSTTEFGWVTSDWMTKWLSLSEALLSCVNGWLLLSLEVGCALETKERGMLSSELSFCDGLLRKTLRRKEPPGPLPKRFLIIVPLNAGAMTGKQAQRMPTAGSMAVQMTRSASSPSIRSGQL